MGVIKKQSISGVIYSYIGVALGFIITGLLFPRLLTTNEVGLLRILVSYSVILSQFAILGMNTVTVKIFPHFRDKKNKHHGYLGLLLLVGLAGFIITTIIYLLVSNYIINDAKEKSELFIPYFYYVIPLLFFSLLFNTLDVYYRVLYNVTKGIIYKEIIQRILVILSVIIFYFKLIDLHTLVVLYTISQILPAILIFISLIIEKRLYLKPDFNFLNKHLLKHMASVAFFGIITSYSGVLIMNIDMVMINHYLGLSSTGIYSITFFFGTLIIIPARTMSKISSVVIADSWKINDKNTILDIYKKSSILLSIAAIFVFIGVWSNIDNVFSIIGSSYIPGMYVIFFIGLANILDAFSGLSSLIIINSKHYKWLSVFLIIYTISIILTNLIFIPLFGISGAAFASFISRLLFTYLRFIFLKKKYQFQPYSYKHILIVIIGIAALYIASLLPEMNNYILDIIFRSILISIVYLPLIYIAKISDDFNNSAKSIVLKITSFDW